MTPPQVALRQIPASQDGLIRLLPSSGWDAEARPGETPEEAAYRAAVDAATAILAAYDGGTAMHSDDVLTVSEAIADRLKVTGDEKKHLTAVAQLHDIGKIMVSSDILNKPGPLNDEEWEAMRRHTIDGERILATVPEISEVAEMVRACHERYDGDGYPDGLGGEDIPLVARIVFCADAFHAMRCDRPYREGRPVEDALAEMKANAGTQFDPVVVAALCDVHATLAIQRKHGLGLLKSGARSRRLVALLATLTVSGSAMAATGAYKDLPLIRDGKDGNVPAVTSDPMAALRSPVFGAEHPSNGAGRQGSSASAGSRGSSGSAAKQGTSSPRSDRNPDPRGVAHGVNGTAPGQSVRPAKVKLPKAAHPAPPVKPPKSKPPRVMPPQSGPKVKLPKVTVPNVRIPNPNANPNAGSQVPPVKVPKLQAPKLQR
jgi:hypothetical protein